MNKKPSLESVVDRLVRCYQAASEETGDRIDVAQFLADENIEQSFALDCDPADIVRLLGREFVRDRVKRLKRIVSDHTDILLGICDLYEKATRPEPKFAYPDIIVRDPKGRPETMVVIDYLHSTDEYVVRMMNGDGLEISREDIDRNCVKIGVSTVDGPHP